MSMGSATAFPAPSHIALLHRGDAEMQDVALEFLRIGLDRPSEALFGFGDPSRSKRLFRALELGAGRDLSPEYRTGRIVLGRADPDVDRMLEGVIAPLEQFRAKGFTLVRFVGIVNWNVPDFPPPEDFLWLESKLSEVFPRFPVIALCLYDVARLPARAIAYGALETHPLVVSGGALRQNPEFVLFERYFHERLLRLPWLEAESARDG